MLGCLGRCRSFVLLRAHTRCWAHAEFGAAEERCYCWALRRRGIASTGEAAPSRSPRSPRKKVCTLCLSARTVTAFFLQPPTFSSPPPPVVPTLVREIKHHQLCRIQPFPSPSLTVHALLRTPPPPIPLRLPCYTPPPPHQSQALRRISIACHRRDLGSLSVALSLWWRRSSSRRLTEAALRRVAGIRVRRELTEALRRWAGAAGAERALEGLAAMVERAVRRARVARALRRW